VTQICIRMVMAFSRLPRSACPSTESLSCSTLEARRAPLAGQLPASTSRAVCSSHSRRIALTEANLREAIRHGILRST